MLIDRESEKNDEDVQEPPNNHRRRSHSILKEQENNDNEGNGEDEDVVAATTLPPPRPHLHIENEMSMFSYREAVQAIKDRSSRETQASLCFKLYLQLEVEVAEVNDNLNGCALSTVQFGLCHGELWKKVFGKVHSCP